MELMLKLNLMNKTIEKHMEIIFGMFLSCIFTYTFDKR